MYKSLRSTFTKNNTCTLGQILNIYFIRIIHNYKQNIRDRYTTIYVYRGFNRPSFLWDDFNFLGITHCPVYVMLYTSLMGVYTDRLSSRNYTYLTRGVAIDCHWGFMMDRYLFVLDRYRIRFRLL